MIKKYFIKKKIIKLFKENPSVSFTELDIADFLYFSCFKIIFYCDANLLILCINELVTEGKLKRSEDDFGNYYNLPIRSVSF